MKFPLVTTDWLAGNLNKDNLVILDASMVSVVGKEPLVYDPPVFIPNSKKLDLEHALCDRQSAMIHAFPTEEQFTAEAQRLGINTDSTVIIYDNQGVYSAPRAWWIFQTMGHANSYVLDGGLPQWLAENRATVSGLSQQPCTPGNLKGVFHADRVCDSGYLVDKMAANRVRVVDARSAARFNGTAPEPRAGVRSGHIPGSLNMPFAQVLDGDRFKKPAQLRALFSQALPAEHQQAVFSCGSGITACIILMAAVIAGRTNCVLYDGSWADWGSNTALPLG
ncbi:sulfurtransferase [Marinobacter sp. X15-166B]|uniref:sulfurtransferase n=1 Tax=Marinobacter sp. X15-166B TaxID=1897620 RepID=UPI00085C300D|nr:sulfurtransferase [Marinobacter sp. X15-166B]OEY65921.1 3-mercaptopyruvate sulfurtransferase [Marinobacter sp. X15-166B]